MEKKLALDSLHLTERLKLNLSRYVYVLVFFPSYTSSTMANGNFNSLFFLRISIAMVTDDLTNDRKIDGDGVR
jgi:hypothetical protein